MLSIMQVLKLCLLHLFLFQSFHFTPTNGFNASAAKVDVGVILDLQTTLGKIFKTCISMAIEDFYSKRSYNTMIVPHFRDSSSDVVSAASAAIDLLKNTQVMAIFGPQKSIHADFVIAICNKVKVPIISPATSPSLSPQESPYFVRSSWSSASQAKAVAAIIKNFDWREVVIVYEDNSYGSGLLPFLTEDLLESSALVSNMTAISPSAESDEILQHLQQLKSMRTRVFVVHMLPSLASRFFKMARGVGMMEEGYAWIISNALTSLLDFVDSETIEAMQGVVGVRSYLPWSNEVRDFRSRWKKRFYEENPEMERSDVTANVFGLWAYDSIAALAEGVERAGVTSQKFKKMVDGGNLTDLEAIGSSNTGPSLVGYLRNFSSKGLSGDFEISNGELQASAFEIMNVIGRGAYRVGFWREKYGISKSLKGKDEKRRLGAVVWPGQTSDAPKGWDINGNTKLLRVGVPLKSRNDDLVKVEWNRETGKVNASGFCIDVFEEVMGSMQYPVQYEYIPFDNGNNAGYNYDGLLYQVFLKRFDVVVAGITITVNRSNYVDFTIPYVESGLSTVVPIDYNKNAWIFMKPLTMGLWLTIGAYFIFTGFVVWALEHRGNQEFRGPPLQQVGMIFWFSFSTLVFAHKEKVKSNLSRFVVIIWLFAVLVLTSSYTASLTSMLTVQKLGPTDIRDLTKRGEYIGFKEGAFVRSLIESTKSDKSKFRMYTSFEQYDEALSRGSRNGGVGAIIDNLPSISVFLYKYCHQYTTVGPTYNRSGFGFPFQKGSPLAPDVSRAILQVKDNGKLDYISNKWFGEEGCGASNATSNASKSLSLDHFKGLFLISGLSSLSALSISLFLFLYKNRRVLTTGGSIKRKLSDLAGAFDRERVDKTPSSLSTAGLEDHEGDDKPRISLEEMVIVSAESAAISILCTEEGMICPDEELSSVGGEIEMQQSKIL